MRYKELMHSALSIFFL